MKILLNRDDIEIAVREYIKKEYLPYGDERELVIVQGTKASASVTFKQAEQLPGLADNDYPEDTDEPEVADGTAVEVEADPEPEIPQRISPDEATKVDDSPEPKPETPNAFTTAAVGN